MLLGGDDQGRDVLSAIFFGLRASLSVGVIATLGAVVIGAILGMTAAMARGAVDTIISRLIELQLSFPAMLVALMLVATIGRGLDKVILALILVQWAYYARTVRGAAQIEVEREYVEAAHCLALPRHRIMFAHILPNCLPVLVVVATIQMAHAIVLEATLSFLGLGMPISMPSLGRLIANGFDYVLSGTYWISLFPGFALLLIVYFINMLGDEFRRILNPQSL
jgi:peptide/nickel transport system permease protein